MTTISVLNFSWLSSPFLCPFFFLQTHQSLDWRSILIAFICFVFTGFPDSSVGKESTCNAEDLGSIPGLGRFSGEGKGYPLSGLENSTECIVHGVAKSRARLNDFYQTLATTILSVQSLSRVRLFATPWAAACQASLSITNS